MLLIWLTSSLVNPMDWLLEISSDNENWMIIAREKTEREANEWAECFKLNNPTWFWRVRMEDKE